MPADEEKSKRRREGAPTLNLKLVRVVRTRSSEVFIIWQGDTRLGQADIHFGDDLIHAR